RAALAGMDGLDIAMDGDSMRISCPPAQKVALLAALFADQGAVRQITIHEPSLEDLFLGYGGRHAQAR
ncbi:MAG TPA: ABC transporter ATP-binding protein, partial [Duganella sp.]|nr:ABC transporter ATP-binding protein [Duganella sp.]